MRKYAVAEGVAPEDIILETKAANNYENVLYCLELMTDLEYSSAIVITSPFNVLRTELILENLLEQVYPVSLSRDSLHLVPVKNPIFYHRQEGNRLAQLRAILHEYAAIIYYWWMGKI